MSYAARRRWPALLLSLLCAAFLALGDWQLHRRVWKLDLIERVQERVHAEPQVLRGREDWTLLSGEADEYRRLQLDGELMAPALLSQAVTVRGPGFWVMRPLRLHDGSVVLLNCGFVDAEHRDPASWQLPKGPASLQGLLRRSETGGGFLRRNDPAAGRWHSRDVSAMAAALSLDPQKVAPFFVDLDASADGVEHWPVAGLTVIRFHNSHLVYALTWFGLAGLSLLGLWLLYREPDSPL